MFRHRLTSPFRCQLALWQPPIDGNHLSDNAPGRSATCPALSGWNAAARSEPAAARGGPRAAPSRAAPSRAARLQRLAARKAPHSAPIVVAAPGTAAALDRRAISGRAKVTGAGGTIRGGRPPPPPPPTPAAAGGRWRRSGAGWCWSGAPAPPRLPLADGMSRMEPAAVVEQWPLTPVALTARRQPAD